MGRPQRKQPILTSEAQVQLAECYVAGELALAELARVSGLPTSQVHTIVVNGERAPKRFREALAKPPYSIPLWQWDAQPGTKDPPNFHDADPLPVSPEEADGVDLSQPDAALELIQRQIVRLQRDLAKARSNSFGLEPNQILRLESAYTNASLNYAKLKHELGPADENRLARSVTFQRLVQRVTAALEPYPDACEAVLAEFGRVK